MFLSTLIEAKVNQISKFFVIPCKTLCKKKMLRSIVSYLILISGGRKRLFELNMLICKNYKKTDEMFYISKGVGGG